MVSTGIAGLALLGRILMLGYERIITKQLTQDRTSLGAAFLFFGIGALIGLPVLLFTGLPAPRVLGYAAAVSLVYAGAFILYVGALARSDASLIGPLYHTSILVVIGLGWRVLDEPVTPLRVAGGLLLLYGTSLLREPGKPLAVVASFRALLRDKGAAMMIGGSLLLGVGRIVDKFIVSGPAADAVGGQLAGTASYGIAQNVFISLWILAALLAAGRLAPTVGLLRERPGRALAAGSLNITSYLLLLAAFTGLDASVAEPASALSMVVTVGLAGAFLHEPWRQRLPGAIVMVAGAWLLFL